MKIQDFPEKQRILYNSNNLLLGTSDVIINNLDDFDYYDPTAVTLTEPVDTMDALEEFDLRIGNEKEKDPIEPFRYGSYYINKVDMVENQF